MNGLRIKVNKIKWEAVDCTEEVTIQNASITFIQLNMKFKYAQKQSQQPIKSW